MECGHWLGMEALIIEQALRGWVVVVVCWAVRRDVRCGGICTEVFVELSVGVI